jgi:predicted methyltransferase
VQRRRRSGWLAIPALAWALAATAADAQHGKLFPPTDLGRLEGPDRDAWQRPDQIMDALGIGDGSVVGDLGAGGGWFTIRLARRVGPNGKVYAEDVQKQMIEAIERRAQRENLAGRVVTKLGDLNDPKLPAGALDVALMVDIYHELAELADPVTFLRNTAKALKPDGRIGVVNFKTDGGGPGPPMDERVEPERVIRDAEAAGLRLRSRETFLRYQYMLVFERPAGATGPPASRRPAAPPRRRTA